jgi:uncharacterized BrkB/YihY/UPF0761 family membrane protein
MSTDEPGVSVSDDDGANAAGQPPADSDAPSRTARAKRSVTAATERGKATFEGWRARSPIVDTSARIALRPRYTLDTIASGYIALCIFVLLFPLAYVIVAGIGITAAGSGATGDDVTAATGLTGGLANSIASAAQGSQRGHVLVIVIGTLTALWAARSLLKALRISHAIAWRLPDEKYKAVDVGPIVVVVGLVCAVFLGSVANRVRNTEGVPTFVAFLVHGGVVAAGWLLASRRLPHAPCPWWFHVPGALLVGLGALSLNIAMTVYFVPKLDHAAETYGALGVGLVLITYLLMVGWMIVLSAELNAGVFELTSPAAPELEGDVVAEMLER